MFFGEIAVNTPNPLPNYINGEWCVSRATEFLDVVNPATAQVLAKVPLSTVSEVDQAAQAAAAAFHRWRRTPPTERVQYLFRLKYLLEENFDELVRTTTKECGKTLAESGGELQRAIENDLLPCPLLPCPPASL